MDFQAFCEEISRTTWTSIRMALYVNQRIEHNMALSPLDSYVMPVEVCLISFSTLNGEKSNNPPLNHCCSFGGGEFRIIKDD